MAIVLVAIIAASALLALISIYGARWPAFLAVEAIFLAALWNAVRLGVVLAREKQIRSGTKTQVARG